MPETIVFQSGNSVAVRLKGECRFPRGTRVRERREGNAVIIEACSGWPQSFREALGCIKEDLPRAPDLQVRQVFP